CRKRLENQATGLGFEPRMREPKSLVLPLHHPVVSQPAGFAAESLRPSVTIGLPSGQDARWVARFAGSGSSKIREESQANKAASSEHERSRRSGFLPFDSDTQSRKGIAPKHTDGSHASPNSTPTERKIVDLARCAQSHFQLHSRTHRQGLPAGRRTRSPLGRI